MTIMSRDAFIFYASVSFTLVSVVATPVVGLLSKLHVSVTLWLDFCGQMGNLLSFPLQHNKNHE